MDMIRISCVKWLKTLTLFQFYKNNEVETNAIYKSLKQLSFPATFPKDTLA